MKFILRSWLINDIDSLVKHANNWNVAKYMNDGFPHPYTKEHAEKFILMTQNFNPQRFFAIIADGKAIGGIGLHPQSDIMRLNAELGYWIAEEYWGKGIVSKAINQIVEYGFENFEITRIFARPFGTNTASKKVLEKSCFVFETKFENTIVKNGETYDELYYSIRKEKQS